jgi:protein-S-isoprenylcysteine O-methyltransferase Ste14
MNRSLLLAMIILPGTVLVLVPGVILWLSHHTRFSPSPAEPSQVFFWVAMGSGAVGLAIITWTVTLFVKIGQGTPAPWEPPKKLVVRGPYRHVRNPMITGVLFVLLAQILLFQSWPLAGWLLVFFIGNAIYFPLVEEKGLEKRFGDAYVAYRKCVPRWIPRIKPWKPGDDDQPSKA